MANKTVELKVLVDPDVRTQIDKVRGLVPMSAWLRDAVLSKLTYELTPGEEGALLWFIKRHLDAERGQPNYTLLQTVREKLSRPRVTS